MKLQLKGKIYDDLKTFKSDLKEYIKNIQKRYDFLYENGQEYNHKYHYDTITNSNIPYNYVPHNPVQYFVQKHKQNRQAKLLKFRKDKFEIKILTYHENINVYIYNNTKVIDIKTCLSYYLDKNLDDYGLYSGLILLDDNKTVRELNIKMNSSIYLMSLDNYYTMITEDVDHNKLIKNELNNIMETYIGSNDCYITFAKNQHYFNEKQNYYSIKINEKMMQTLKVMKQTPTSYSNKSTNGFDVHFWTEPKTIQNYKIFILQQIYFFNIDHLVNIKLIDCQLSNFTIVITPQLKTLNLSHNKLTEFKFKYYGIDDIKLLNLILDYNNMQHIDISLLNKVKNVSCTNNELTGITMTTDYYYNVEELNLSHNKIKNINKLFAKKINLSHNMIKEYTAMKMTSDLDISYNQNEHLDLRYNLSMIYLNASNNNLDYKRILGLSKLTKLQDINLANNNFTEIDLPINYDYVDVNLSHNKFSNIEDIRNISKKNINLINNDIDNTRIDKLNANKPIFNFKFKARKLFNWIPSPKREDLLNFFINKISMIPRFIQEKELWFMIYTDIVFVHNSNDTTKNKFNLTYDVTKEDFSQFLDIIEYNASIYHRNNTAIINWQFN